MWCKGTDYLCPMHILLMFFNYLRLIDRYFLGDDGVFPHAK